METNKKGSESSKIYKCLICNYNTVRNNQYCRHLATAKHIRLTNANGKVQKSSSHICLCGNEYKHASSLCKHKRTCSGIAHNITSVIDSSYSESSVIIKDNLIIELLKQNQDFKDLMIEQSKQITELMKINGNTTNNTTNNTNCHNKFNLNFFLNNTCKDAINMSEFIETIEVQMNELENIGHNGYVAGMTDIILSRIKVLDVSKRPVHCTDLKREIMYIKDQNEWNKDTAEKSYLRKAISMVSKKNCGKTMEWRERNPECLEIGSPKYDFCFKMMRNVLGDFEDVQVKMDHKIIKSLAKEVVVDR